MTVSLRRMRWRDIDRLHVLERALFGDDSWSAELFWSELAQRDSRHYVVAVQDGDLVGYAGLAAYDSDGYVQTLAVVEGAQRRGVGALLMRELLREAVDRGVRCVALEVRVDNEPAQALYRRLGFAPVGLRRGYYQPSGADALVMVADVTSDSGPPASTAPRAGERVSS